jgi:uncharacterized membrane protein
MDHWRKAVIGVAIAVVLIVIAAVTFYFHWFRDSDAAIDETGPTREATITIGDRCC